MFGFMGNFYVINMIKEEIKIIWKCIDRNCRWLYCLVCYFLFLFLGFLKKGIVGKFVKFMR